MLKNYNLNGGLLHFSNEVDIPTYDELADSISQYTPYSPRNIVSDILSNSSMSDIIYDDVYLTLWHIGSKERLYKYIDLLSDVMDEDVMHKVIFAATFGKLYGVGYSPNSKETFEHIKAIQDMWNDKNIPEKYRLTNLYLKLTELYDDLSDIGKSIVDAIFRSINTTGIWFSLTRSQYKNIILLYYDNLLMYSNENDFIQDLPLVRVILEDIMSFKDTPFLRKVFDISTNYSPFNIFDDDGKPIMGKEIAKIMTEIANEYNYNKTQMVILFNMFNSMRIFTNGILAIKLEEKELLKLMSRYTHKLNDKLAEYILE